MQSSRNRRVLVIAAALVLIVGFSFWIRRNRNSRVTQPADAPRAAAARYGYEIVREYPHDTEAFTQGLIYRDGFLYESTGHTGRSSLRKVRLETGEVVRQRPLFDVYYAEGLTDWDGTLVQLAPIRTDLVNAALAPKHHLISILTAAARQFRGLNAGFTYDTASLEPRATFTFEGEGWGLTHDEKNLIMSDGTPRLRFLDPGKAFLEVRSVQVRDEGRPLDKLNELEWVKGSIYANVWRQDKIAIIRPDSGAIAGWIDLSGLAAHLPSAPTDPSAVLNGIAYDPAGDRLFVTGKLWPRVFEIRLKPLEEKSEQLRNAAYISKI